MKLIVDIDDEIQNKISVMGLDRLTPDDIRTVSRAISHGTPLDDIKAEIDQKQYDFMADKDYDEGIRFGLMLAYQILDKHISVKENEDE